MSWYRTSLPFLPFPTVFGSRAFDETRPLPYPLGEVGGAWATYNGKWNIAGLLGGHICGTPDQFLNGYDPANPGPPLTAGPDGIPTCCPRAQVGQVSSGMSPMAMVNTFTSYYDPPTGGLTLAPVVLDHVIYSDPPTGGLTLAPVVLDQVVYYDPPTGGLTLAPDVLDRVVYSDPPTGGLTLAPTVTDTMIGTLSTLLDTGGPLSFSNALTLSGSAQIQLTVSGDTITITFIPTGPAPSVPTGVSATPQNASALAQWTAPAGTPPAANYSVYYSTASNMAGAVLAASGVTGTSYNITGLVNGTTYYVAVVAVSSIGGSSGFSSVQTVVPSLDLVGSRVQNAQGIAHGVNTVAATWGTATTTGNFLVAVGVCYNTGSGYTAPAGWTLAASYLFATIEVHIWYIAASASRSGTETFTATAGVSGNYPYVYAWIAEYHQLRAFGGVDTSTSNNASGTSSASAPVSVAGAGELVVTGIGGENFPSSATYNSPTNGFALPAQDSVTSSNNYLATAVLDLLATSAAGSIGSTVTITASLATRVLTVAFE
jgi:Fibronectin type III domain